MDRHALGLGHRDAVGDPVEGPDTGPPGAQDHPGRHQPRRPVRHNRRPQRRPGHRPVSIRRHLHQVPLPDPRHPDRLVDRAVRLGTRVEPQAPARPTAPPSSPRQPSARSRMVRTADSVALVAESWIVPDEPLGQPQRLPQPVDHHLLDLGRGGRGLPDQRVAGHRVDQLFRQHRSRGRIGREIGEEARVLPMGHAVRHDALEIGPDRLHRLGRLGGASRQLPRHGPRHQRRPHRPVAQASRDSPPPSPPPASTSAASLRGPSRTPSAFRARETMSPGNRQASTAIPTRRLLFAAISLC